TKTERQRRAQRMTGNGDGETASERTGEWTDAIDLRKVRVGLGGDWSLEEGRRLGADRYVTQLLVWPDCGSGMAGTLDLEKRFEIALADIDERVGADTKTEHGIHGGNEFEGMKRLTVLPRLDVDHENPLLCVATVYERCRTGSTGLHVVV